MARLNVEVIPPDSEVLNGIFAEIERKYARQPLTPKVIDEMQREATRLVRRMITGYVRPGLTLQKPFTEGLR